MAGRKQRRIRVSGQVGPVRLKVDYQWDGINSGTVAPADTVKDVYFLYTPGELENDLVTVNTVVLNGYVENIDSANADVDIGVIIAAVDIDGAGFMVNDLDPLNTNLEDFQMKNIMYRQKFNFRGSAASNNYWYRWQDYRINTKRKLNAWQALALIVRGSDASDWQYNFDCRALLKVGSS